VAGYFGGAFDAIISRITDTMIAFPFIVLVIAVISIVGPGVKGVLIGVPIVAWALYARLARSEMLVLREQPFMLATSALGYSRRRAILRHAVPNLMRSSLIYSTLDMVVNILLLASLAYLGLGAQPPNAELGSIIADGQSTLLTAWWVATLPGLVVVLFGVGAGLLGDGLSDGQLRGRLQ
jgi:peptide/nickel transport system permease protein